MSTLDTASRKWGLIFRGFQLATGFSRNTSHQMQCFPTPCSTPEHHLLTEICFTAANRLSIDLTARQRGISLGILVLQIVYPPQRHPNLKHILTRLLRACHSCSNLLIHMSSKEFGSSTFMDPPAI